jgi:DNA-binding HxlR family transcriptional regulator
MVPAFDVSSEAPSEETHSTNSPGALALVSLADHLSKPDTPIPWLVDGLLVEGERCIVFGEPGSQKSWLLLDMAICIASGEDWLGHFKVPTARQVLYVDEEQSERVLNKRLKQLVHGRTNPSPSAPLKTLSHDGLRFTKGGAERLLAKLSVAGFDPDVVMVEALARVLDGNENEIEAVSAFWRHLEPLRKAGKTVIISHHMRKPNPMGSNAPRDRLRGSTDLLAGTDSAFAVEATREDGKVRSVTVGCSKFREAEAPASFEAELVDLDSAAVAVKWHFKGQVATGAASTPAQPQTKGQQAEALILTELLKAGTSLSTAELKTKAGNVNISESMVEEALRSLEKRGETTTPRRGKRTLTTIGEAAARTLVAEPAETGATNVPIDESAGGSVGPAEAEAA